MPLFFEIMDILELNKRLQNLDIDLLKEQSVRKSSREIIQFNQYQLRQGMTSDDKMIVPFYSKSWGTYKKTLSSYGLDGLKVNLFDTGMFQKNMYLIVDNGEYFVNSTDSKTRDLTDKYSSKIFGIGNKSKADLIPIVTKNLGEIFKKQVGL